MNATIEELLEELAQARARSAQLQSEVNEAVAMLMPPEVRKAIQDYQDEMSPMLNSAVDAVMASEANVRAWVLANSKGGKAAGLEATYTEGRASWDTKALMRASKKQPELLHFLSYGDPYCTIRSRKE